MSLCSIRFLDDCPVPTTAATDGLGARCDPGSCINNNAGYTSLHEAWLRCSEVELCTNILLSEDDQTFYLRAATDDFGNETVSYTGYKFEYCSLSQRARAGIQIASRESVHISGSSDEVWQFTTDAFLEDDNLLVVLVNSERSVEESSYTNNAAITAVHLLSKPHVVIDAKSIVYSEGNSSSTASISLIVQNFGSKDFKTGAMFALITDNMDSDAFEYQSVSEPVHAVLEAGQVRVLTLAVSDSKVFLDCKKPYVLFAFIDPTDVYTGALTVASEIATQKLSPHADVVRMPISGLVRNGSVCAEQVSTNHPPVAENSKIQIRRATPEGVEITCPGSDVDGDEIECVLLEADVLGGNTRRSLPDL